MKFSAKKIATLAILTALAIILSILDGFIPSFIPGMKLGLANIVILMILYSYGFKEALFVNLLKVFIAGVLRGNFFNMGFFMSLSGAIFSLIVMFLLKRFIPKIHIVGVSVIGSVIHSLAQVLVGMIFINSISFLYYLPILSLTSVITGIIMGLLAQYLNKFKFLKE